MLDILTTLFAGGAWWNYLVRAACFYALAWGLHALAPQVARVVVRLGRFGPPSHRSRPERRRTLIGVLSSAITATAFVAATLATLAQFVDLNTLVWVVGLFSAAFGLGARPLISDLLAGVNLLFEDTYAVGEKVEVLGAEGVIEEVKLRTTSMRAPTGELYVVPNGDVRVVRNFTRGRFSTANVTVKIGAGDLAQALPLLQELGHEAMMLLPNLLEPWQVISESGLIGQQTELTLLARARLGRSAEMRPRMLALVHERLSEYGIELRD